MNIKITHEESLLWKRFKYASCRYKILFMNSILYDAPVECRNIYSELYIKSLIEFSILWEELKTKYSIPDSCMFLYESNIVTNILCDR